MRGAVVTFKRVPSKNTKKTYVENGYYHLYNRGVEKRVIFRDHQDHITFLRYLEEYLSPKDEEGLWQKINDPLLSPLEKDKALAQLRRNNFFGKIELLCFSLMPNHLHFQLRQKEAPAIDIFTNSLITRYVGYFNRKYERVGHLFQDVYKAVLVESEEQLLHLSRYIHRNPLQLGERGRRYQENYTSLPEYLGQRTTPWIKTDPILSYFTKNTSANSYGNFVNETEVDENITHLLLE